MKVKQNKLFFFDLICENLILGAKRRDMLDSQKYMVSL